MKWTAEQENVIKYRNRNILVSAAAGSGKTAVLVERIIKRITDQDNPVDIDKLLVVTFTKAAAAEMKERISSAIEKQIEIQPEDDNLRKQQTLVHNAQITTIDSFCLFVVRNYFQEIDLDPNFRIADQGEIKLLELDVLQEVFEQEYIQAKDQTVEESSFLQLVDAYSDKRSNRAVKDMIAKIYHQSSSEPWPKEWISKLARPYQVETIEELLETDLMKGIFVNVKAMLMEMPARLMQLKEIALMPDGPNKYAENLTREIEQFNGIENISTYQELAVFCKSLEFGRLAAIQKYQGDPQKKEAVSAGRTAIKEEIKLICDQYFKMPLDQLVEQLKHMRMIAEEVVRLSLIYLDAMEKRKLEKHIMDFSDIEHAALRILVDENTKTQRDIALEFQKHFEEIMIDEYQDSNQVQEEIMCAISRQARGEYNMFMVGDVKQSIYRFRLARPELFMEKFATYDLEESKKQRIDLHKNFRSRAEVLDFTNDVFYKIMAQDLGKVTYDSQAALYCGASYPESDQMEAEVLLYETDANEDALDQEDDLTKRQLEARMVADKILELKQTLLVKDKKTEELRPLRNSDIVILLRSLRGWGNDFATVLGEYDIPAHVATSTGYFSAIEVQTLLSLLKILDNPYQDIPMAAVLKSAIVGLDDEELAELSLKKDANSFAEAVMTQMEEETEGKLYTFGQMYHRLRKKVSDTPIHQLIHMVLEETGYDDYVKALPMGSRRKANLDMLVEKAIAYEQTSYKGLFHFVRYIEQLQKYDVDFGEADVTGEGEDVVRLMTIHKSKGLEFPVVFVSGIAKKFNESDSRDKMAIHPDMGLGLDEVSVSPRTKRKCLIRTEIADRVRRDNLGEELRVLYVAMTRAKEKLILTGTTESKEKIYDAYKGNIHPYQPLSYGQRVKAKSYVDWIAPAVLSYPDKYSFTFKNASDLVFKEASLMAEKELAKAVLLQEIENADDELVESYRQCFSYTYPYEQDAKKKSKYSVSEMKHASMVEKYDRLEGELEVPEFLLEEREPYIPEFARVKESDDMEVVSTNGVNRGALRGTAVHRVMECLDFKKLLQLDLSSKACVEAFLAEEIQRMLEKNLITEEMQSLLQTRKLIAFLTSSVALQMARADERGDLFREKPFVMDYEGVLLQGIIDVFWLEEDSIFLLDYKTDRVQTKEELITRYETQLNLYAKALCRIFSFDENDKNSTKNLIYSFSLDETIVVNEE